MPGLRSVGDRRIAAAAVVNPFLRSLSQAAFSTLVHAGRIQIFAAPSLCGAKADADHAHLDAAVRAARPPGAPRTRLGMMAGNAAAVATAARFKKLAARIVCTGTHRRTLKPFRQSGRLRVFGRWPFPQQAALRRSDVRKHGARRLCPHGAEETEGG